MLTREEIDQFHQEGYLVFERLIEGEKLEAYLAVFDELVEQGRDLKEGIAHFSLELDEDGQPIPGLLHKVQGVCVAEPRTLELAREPAILERVAALLGPDLDLFGTKFFPKLPNGGTSTHWHQDNFYFGTTSDRIVSCGIYLQDADEENGCLRVMPGSHKIGSIVEHKSTPNSYGSWTEVDESRAVDLPMPAGTVTLFSANLLHGAGANTSQRPRYSTAWHYVPGDLELERFPREEYADRHILGGN